MQHTPRWRTAGAKLCHSSGREIEQIQLLLEDASVLTSNVSSAASLSWAAANPQLGASRCDRNRSASSKSFASSRSFADIRSLGRLRAAFHKAEIIRYMTEITCLWAGKATRSLVCYENYQPDEGESMILAGTTKEGFRLAHFIVQRHLLTPSPQYVSPARQPDAD